jgi:hypothetical protein
MGGTGFGGPSLAKGLLMLDHSIRLLPAKKLLFSPGKVFGGPRPH